MALRREIDEFLKSSFEELVELVVEQREKIEDLEGEIAARDDVIDERDAYIRDLLEAVQMNERVKFK